MKTIKYFNLIILWISCFVCNVHAANNEDTVVFRYKPAENINYLVDRTRKSVYKHNNNEIKLFHDIAVISYGDTSLWKSGKIRLMPTVNKLFYEGDLKVRKEFSPVVLRQYPTGLPERLSNGYHRGQTRDFDVSYLAELFDIFPIFDERNDSVKETWDIEIRMGVPGLLKAILHVPVHHRLQGFEYIDKKKIAIIIYDFEGDFDAFDNQEVLESSFNKIAKPYITFNGQGTAHFDLSAGIITKQEQCIEWNRRWPAGRFDKKLAKKYPKSAAGWDEVHTSHITVKLISDDEANCIIKEAEEARAQAKAAAEADRLAKPVVEEGPSWKYLVERTTTERNNLKDKEETFIDRAIVHYGANARLAGGQLKTVPQVIFVDEHKKRLPKARYHLSAIIPHEADKFTMTGKLPQEMGEDSDFPVPVRILAKSFSMLPLEPKEKLREGLSWSPEFYMCFIVPKLWFPAAINHEVAGYEQKQGRRCAVIKYTIAGEFKPIDHPDRFDAERLREGRGEYGLKGEGTVYFDPAEGIIVQKDQTLSWTRVEDRLTRFEDGTEGWKPKVDNEKTVSIRVVLQPNETESGSDAAEQIEQLEEGIFSLLEEVWENMDEEQKKEFSKEKWLEFMKMLHEQLEVF